MTTNTMLPIQTNSALVDTSKISKEGKIKLAQDFCSFLDTLCTATSRATFYNTKDEQTAAIHRAHEAIFDIDRGVYQMTLMLPGVTDFSRQVGTAKLLSNPVLGRKFCLNEDIELKVLKWIVRNIEPQRAYKLFVSFIGDKNGGSRVMSLNNARTRKVVLDFILNNEYLPLHAIKYRQKLRKILSHVIGLRMTSIVRSILSKTNRDDKEQDILNGILKGYRGDERGLVLESVAFILGAKREWVHDRFVAFEKAKTEGIEHGEKLPPEVLEGIRSRYWKDTKKAKVIETTKDTMTKKQKRQVQKRAKAAGVEVEFNPAQYGLVELYIYAFEMGMTEEIERALDKKAQKIADNLPLQLDKVAIVVDCSESMFGHGSQKLRPIAVALAMRDVIQKLAKVSCKVFNCGGREDGRLVRPRGDTFLAEGLVKAMKTEPDAVFVISDGYENAPAGRFAEVVYLLRNKLKNETPIYQLSPVLSSETAGIRSLSEMITPLPVSSPDALGIPMLKALFAADVDRGIQYLSSLTVPRLENSGRSVS